MRPLLLVALGLVAGCTVRATPDGGTDAGLDAPTRDGGYDAGIDAPSLDAPADVGVPLDVGVDAPLDAPADAPTDTPLDAPPDAPMADAGPTCGISAGDTIALDGASDLAAYPGSQLLPPGAPVAATDAVAITWDPTFLYVTVTSDGFLDAFEPFHLYLETATTLGTALPSTGKEYGGLVAALPFSPTHAIALRRTSDSGTGPYDGVYTPGGSPAWSTRSFALAVGTNVYVSADARTLSARVPWTALGGCPARMRLAAHLVHGDVGNEWKDLVPTTHTPWLAPGGGFYEIDLTTDPAVSGWTLR